MEFAFTDLKHEIVGKSFQITLGASFLKDNPEAIAAYNIARAVQRTKAHRTTTKEPEVVPEVPVIPATPAASADATVA